MNKDQLKEHIRNIFNDISNGSCSIPDVELDILSQSPDILRDLNNFKQLFAEHEAHSNQIDQLLNSDGAFEGSPSTSLYSEPYSKILDTLEDNLGFLLFSEETKKHPLKKAFFNELTDDLEEVRSLQRQHRELELLDSHRDKKFIAKELADQKAITLKTQEEKANLEGFKNSFGAHGKKGGQRIRYEAYYELITELIKVTELDPNDRKFVSTIRYQASKRVMEMQRNGSSIEEPSERQTNNIIKKKRDLLLK